MKTIGGTGVLYVMAHLLITLAILGVYAYSVATGHPDETSKALLFSIVGYWFGAVGLDKIKPGQATPPNSKDTTGGQN